MDRLYQLFCISKPASLDISDLKGGNFNQFLDVSLRSARSITRDKKLKRDATNELTKLLSSKSHSPSNTIRIMNTMFESAIGATHLDRERDLIEWLQVCVNTAVQYALDPKAIEISEKATVSSGKKKSSTTSSTTKKQEETETDVSWEEDDGERYEYIGESDEDYVPSDDAVVPEKKKTTRKKNGQKVLKKKKDTDQTVPSSPPKSPRKKDEATIPVLKEGAGSKSLVKYFMDLDTKAFDNSTSITSLKNSGLPSGYFARSFFFPSKNSFNAFLSALNSAKKTIDICVFAFTDDDVADTLIAAKKRGVTIRIITDNQQAAGKGADAKRLQESYGIPFKTDKTNGYMHNKFAIIDSSTLINGSFNWSKGARFKNRENVIITNLPICIKEFQAQFNVLWSEF